MDHRENRRPDSDQQRRRRNETDRSQERRSGQNRSLISSDQDTARRKKRRPQEDSVRRIRQEERERIEARRRYLKAKQARAKRQRFVTSFIIIVIMVAIIAAAAMYVWTRLSPTNEKADLKGYYGIEESDELAVVIDSLVYRNVASDPIAAKSYEGQAYIEYSVVRKNINSRFYWDPNESIMLYTLPTGDVSVGPNSNVYTELGEEKSTDYQILITDGSTAYIAVPFIQQYTNMEYSVYEDPGRVCITSKWRTVSTATMDNNTEVRYQGGVKSPVLTEVAKGDKVRVLEDEIDWMKVCTEDGFVGYVKTSTLGMILEEELTRDFSEPEYMHIHKDHPINMAWNNVESEYANSFLTDTLANVSGINTIAPTWFYVADTEGNVSSIATYDYVEYAHQSGLEVWPTLRDFNGGINSYDETYELLRYTSKRRNLINQAVSAALYAGVEGINLDFELVSLECGEHYIQFVRELSVKCHENGLILSIDNYVPQPYNEHYDLKEQATVADYVFIMAYDEHVDSSETAGPVASYDYVANGIADALKKVPADQLVLGINFYSRVWISYTSDGQAVRETTTLTMSEADEILANYGQSAHWDEETSLNYAEWTSDDGSQYKLWIEDITSLEKKLKLIKQNELAGVAEWKLGQEKSDIWGVISGALN